MIPVFKGPDHRLKWMLGNAVYCYAFYPYCLHTKSSLAPVYSMALQDLESTFERIDHSRTLLPATSRNMATEGSCHADLRPRPCDLIRGQQ